MYNSNKHIIFRLKNDYEVIKNQIEKLSEINDTNKTIIFHLKNKIKWYDQFVKLENERFETEFSNKLNQLFTPTQIQLLLNPKKKNL